VYERKIPRLSGIEAYENYFILRRSWPLSWLPNRRKVVDPLSAARYFGPPRHLPDTDHYSIAKPDSLDHPSHQLVVDLWNEFKTNLPDRHFRKRPTRTRPSNFRSKK